MLLILIAVPHNESRDILDWSRSKTGFDWRSKAADLKFRERCVLDDIGTEWHKVEKKCEQLLFIFILGRSISRLRVVKTMVFLGC